METITHATDFAQRDEASIRILGILGSLRRGSYNRLLLRAASHLLPANSELEIFELDAIPLFNEDIESLAFPKAVKDFKGKIESADALLFSTPEYNHSYPGVLKNAIDWASRPYGDNSFQGKPISVVSASPGGFGGVRGQDRVRQDLLALNAKLIVQPEVAVGSANQKFDADGNLLDPAAQQFMKQLLANLVEAARKASLIDKTFVAPALRPVIMARYRAKE